MNDDRWDDDWSDTEEFDDEPLDDDDDDEQSSELLPCPQCGAEIYEDAVQCPSCGTYIEFSTNLLSGRSWWWIALAVAGMLAVSLALTGLVR